MRFGAAIAGIALIAAGAQAQHKNNAGGDSTAFAEMYKRAGKLFETKDAKGIYRNMTADFTQTADGRKQDRASSFAGLQQFLNFFKTLHCTFAMKSCKVSGNSATTTDSVHVWGLTPADSKTHKAHQIDAIRSETFTWVKSGGHWMVKSIVAKSDKMTMDGKSMLPSSSKT